MGDTVVILSLLPTCYREINCSSQRPVGDAESFWLNGTENTCVISLRNSLYPSGRTLLLSAHLH